ncbi:Mkks [Symbiodinium sp. CCMP2592]|nr:Mkks [Symbiodinium sp. CCMP2592]
MESEELQELSSLLRAASLGAGPGGRTYARKVAPVPGARLVASSCSAQVLKFWPAEPNHHLLRLILDSAQGHLAAHSDGGWLFLQLCIRIFHALQDFPAPAALHGLAQAASDVTSALSDGAIRRELDWSKLPSVLALLRGVLCKPLALAKPADTRHLCAVALEAFLHTTPGMEAGRPWQEVVRFEWCCGQDVAWSESHRGLVLDTPGSLVPSGKGDGPIALFAASLEQWLPQEDFEEVYEVETLISSSAPSAAASLRDWEILQFKKLADSLLAAGTKALACQKLVDPWLIDYLHARGVSVLWRLSIRHIDFVRRLTGARPVSSLAALPSWSEALGWVGPLEHAQLGARNYIRMAPPAKHPALPISTLTVGAPDEHALNELKYCLPQAFHVLWEAARTGAVLLGGGLTELHLAGRLRENARTANITSTVAAVMRAVADSLTASAASLAPDAAPSAPASSPAGAAAVEAATAVLEELRHHPAKLPPGMVLDAETPKSRAILGALDLAGILLRIGQVQDFKSQKLG